ncbi:hypothetical protein QBC45DRAFT_421006 [Copromyces sp. CBS 386.78]|nr:hypothetical protein QBC45DRAFT_421006 [Copromyces sp. CBS 386.78]
MFWGFCLNFSSMLIILGISFSALLGSTTNCYVVLGLDLYMLLFYVSVSRIVLEFLIGMLITKGIFCCWWDRGLR